MKWYGVLLFCTPLMAMQESFFQKKIKRALQEREKAMLEFYYDCHRTPGARRKTVSMAYTKRNLHEIFVVVPGMWGIDMAPEELLAYMKTYEIRHVVKKAAASCPNPNSNDE